MIDDVEDVAKATLCIILKTLKQFLAGIKPEVKNDADEKKEKELIKRTLLLEYLGHKNEPQRNNYI